MPQRPFLPRAAFLRATFLRGMVCAGLVLGLAACGSAPKKSPAGSVRPVAPASQTTSQTAPASASSVMPDLSQVSRNKGAYYLDDGPMDASGINLDAIPDATPAVEPLHRFANRPYNIFGVDYIPQLSLEDPMDQLGIASWYGRKFHGQRTSSGEIYDMFAMTAAHPTMPIPSYARVTNPRNGRSVIVRVNDRGPFLHSRVIDLSYAAAHRLGYAQQGSAQVRVEKLTPVLIAQLNRTGPTAVTAVATAQPPVPSILSVPTVAPSAPVVIAASPNTVPAAAPAMAEPAIKVAAVPSGSSVPTIAANAATAVTQAAESPQLSVQAQVAQALLQDQSPNPAVAGAVPATASSVDASLLAAAPLGNFFLQLGAFSVEDNARAFLSRLSLEFSGHLPNLHIVRREPHFRLLAGPYRSREEAQQASRRLKDLAAIAAVIVTP